jgi:hypothetical protein
VESKLTFSPSTLQINASNTDGGYVRIFGGVYPSASPYISAEGLTTTLQFGSLSTGRVFDFRNNKIAFDSDSTNTYIQANTSDPEDLEIHADQDILLMADNNVGIGTITPSRKLDVNGDTWVESNLYVGAQLTHKVIGDGGVSGSYADLTTSDWDTLIFVYLGGDFLKVGTAISVTAGNLYNLGSSGWVAADADATSTSTGFLGVGIQTATVNTFLTEGYVLITNYTGTEAVGAPVYVDTTAGSFTFTAPTGSGDVVRIVGHCVDIFDDGRGGTRPIIRFKPSNDWIELT